jgi:uroporphyrinogen-III synthase
MDGTTMTHSASTPSPATRVANPTAGARPLEGIRIAVTHAAEQAEEQGRLFRELGGEVFLYPAIELAPFEKTDELDAALTEAAHGGFDWLVLNDADTILVVAERVKALGLDPQQFPRRLKVASIGCMTDQWTSQLLGLKSDFAPEIYTPHYVAEQLKLGAGQRVLLPQSSMTRATLAKCLNDTGAEVAAINAYRTLIGRGGDPVPAMLWEGQIDAITFTFPTAVRYFSRRLKAEGGSLAMLDNVVVGCIGPLTRSAAEDLGIHVNFVPEQHTIEGLVAAMALQFAPR